MVVRTYGDSVRTPGEWVEDKCYILAQLPDVTNVDWARDLRIALGGGELKFAQYLTQRHKVQAKTGLWKRIVAGTSEATIVVIENSYYIQAIYFSLKDDGAELGEDYDMNDLLKKAALLMVQLSPVVQLEDPLELDVPYLMPGPPNHTPESILQRIGGDFRDAIVFSARAEASTCDESEKTKASPKHLQARMRRIRPASSLRSVERIFDEEHKKSAEVLNEIMVGYGTYDYLSDNTLTPAAKLVSEAPSHSSDFLQAADFCAGFASEIMMNELNDRERALRRHFRRVIFNGRVK